MTGLDEFDAADIPEGFASWSDNDKDGFCIRLRWCKAARPEQLPPVGNWWIWLLLAGRGFGKTRTAAEDIAYHAVINPGWRLSVVAPTAADVRDTCIEGESGILAILERQNSKLIQKWNRSMGELILCNSSIIKCYPGDEPDRLRGPQAHRTWVDELAAMDRQDDCWANVEMMTRLKPDPRIIVTTTPRPTALIRDLVARSKLKTAKQKAEEMAAAARQAEPSASSKNRSNTIYNSFVQM